MLLTDGKPIENHKAANGHAPVSTVEKNDEVLERAPSLSNMPRPPDGGWGWVVVFSSFMIHVIADGVTYTFGIFYVEFVDYYKESRGVTAWVASIMVGVTFCIGPLASALTNRYGCRAVSIAGALLASLGLAISTLAPNVIFLFFSVGLCTGAGFGLMYLPAIVCVTCYFERRRAFATGIAVCGSGFGTFALAPLVEWLVDLYGWKGAMLLVSGLVLNCVLFGALFRPLEAVSETSDSQAPEEVPFMAIPCSLKQEVTHGSMPTVQQEIVDEGPRPRLYSLSNERSLTPTREFKPRGHGSKATRSQSHAGFESLLLPSRVRLTSLRKSSGSVISSHDLHRAESPAGRTTSNAGSGMLYRKDIFYSGSVMNLPEYRSNPVEYTRSATSLSATPSHHVNHNEVNHGEKNHTDTEPKSTGLCTSVRQIFTVSKEMKDVFTQMTDTSLLRNPVFFLFAISNFFTNIGFNVPFVYIKDRTMDMGLAEDDKASLLLSVIGIANTGGRVLLGYLSDKSWINRLSLYNICLTICGLTTALSSLCITYPWMAAYAASFGFTAGAYVSLTSVILVDLLGLDKLTNAFGLLLVFEGVSCLVGPPITGWLYDGFGSYDPGFWVCGVMIAVSGLMLFAIPCLKRMQRRKEKEEATKMNGECLEDREKETLSV